MDRQAHERAAAAAAARADAEMGVEPPSKAGNGLPEIIRDALEAFAKPLAERLRRMDARIDDVESDVSKTRMALNHKQPGQAEIRDLLARGITDIRNEVRADVVRLTAELEAARREIETLKQAGQGVRMVR